MKGREGAPWTFWRLERCEIMAREGTMMARTPATFQQALEMVEGLPEEQQQDLVDIVRSRQRERRCEALAASIEQARRELARGEVQRGTVDDLMEGIDDE